VHRAGAAVGYADSLQEKEEIVIGIERATERQNRLETTIGRCRPATCCGAASHRNRANTRARREHDLVDYQL
jgi:acetyl-CoA carboxylase alpha subunit